MHLGKKNNLTDYQYLDINIKHQSSNTEKGSVASKYYLSEVKFHGIISICQAACIICERKRREACIHVQFGVIHFEYRFICCYVVMCATPNTPEISNATKAPTIIRHQANKFCCTFLALNLLHIWCFQWWLHFHHNLYSRNTALESTKVVRYNQRKQEIFNYH